MNIDANAKTCVKSRKLLVERIEKHNWPLMEAAESVDVKMARAVRATTTSNCFSVRLAQA